MLVHACLTLLCTAAANAAAIPQLEAFTSRMHSSLIVSRRQAIFAAGLASTAAPKIAAAATLPLDEAAKTLETAVWEETPPFTREDFRRLDESSDGKFYEEPRLVYHVDDNAVAATRQYYCELFQGMDARRNGQPLDVLDLCSSWVSHYPDATEGLRYGRVAGLGMNSEELAANRQLSDFVVQDLNEKPILPYREASFDLVTMTVSIDYLTKPVQVMADVARVLKPGGVVAIVFSDRLFFSKAVALWTGKDDQEHVYTVGSYIHYASPAFSPPMARDLNPRESQRKTSGQAKRKSDPLYVVYASRV